MKNTKKIALLIVALSIGTASPAQLGGMLKKAAKAASTADKVNNTVNAVSGTKGGAGGGVVGSKAVALDWKQYPQTAAITMESLLDGTEVSDHGNLRLNFYRGTFIPNKTASGQSVEPLYKNENTLSVKLFVNDKMAKEIFYSGGDYFTEGKQVQFRNDRISDTDMDMTEEGKYRLDFYAGDKMFYTFDFEVFKKVDTDPYASSSTFWYAKGPWEKFAYVTPQTTGNFIFGFYMMHTDFKPNPNDPRKETKSVVWYPELYKDGKLISVPNKQTAIVDKEYKNFQTSIKLVGAKDFLKIAELADGNYTFKVKVDGEAAPREYAFAMKGGQIVQSAKQDRTKNTDPTRLVEGWNNFFWLERK